MFYNYNLNIETNWNFLPWKKINTRIIVIQHKIYKAAKQYNLKYLYELQKYLLNSNEAKINAIKYITDKLYVYHKNRKAAKYSISDIEKFYIFKHLYKKKINNNFHILIDQIKQYLIYICINPEWKAKFFFNFIQEKHRTIFDDIDSINKYNLSNHLYEYHLTNKYLFIESIFRKTTSSQYIKKNIKLGLYSYICIYFKSFKLRYIHNIIKYSYIFADELYIFLSKIFLLGLDWYDFFLSKLNILKKQIHKVYLIRTNRYINYDNQNKNQVIYYNVISYFREVYKQKIFFFNNNKTFFKLLNYTNLYQGSIFYNYIYLYFIKLIYPISNLYIYYLFKKKYNNIFFSYSNLKINSNNINLLFYNQKLKYIYFNNCF